MTQFFIDSFYHQLIHFGQRGCVTHLYGIPAGNIENGKYIGYEKFPFPYASGILAIIGKPERK